MNYKYGALFDMDGVIVDNADYHIKAFEEWCREKDLPFDKNLFKAKLFGKQNADIFYALMGKEMPAEYIAKEGKYKEEIYRRLYTGNVRAVDGLIGFLDGLKEVGFGIALATSGPPENVELTLGETGAISYFDAIVTCLDTAKGKPDPEVFLMAASKLGLPPERCAVFEDSPVGAKAAHAAGAVLIGVATGHPYLENAAIMINNYHDISPADVMWAIDANQPAPIARG